MRLKSYYLFRFVYDAIDDPNHERTVWYGTARCASDGHTVYAAGDASDDDVRRREWDTTDDVNKAFHCVDVPWAKRRAKIAKVFKDFFDDDEWRFEVVKVTYDEDTLSKPTEDCMAVVFPLAAITQLGSLIDDVAQLRSA